MHYRDTKTGRFVAATTWSRSRAHGGTRYKRHAPYPGEFARHKTTSAVTIPSGAGTVDTGGAGAGAVRPYVTGPIIPEEFLDAMDDYFESGYEADEEDEYP